MTYDLQRELREALADLSSCQRVLQEGIQLAVDRGLAQEVARFRSLQEEVVSLECDVLDELATESARFSGLHDEAISLERDVLDELAAMRARPAR